MDYSEMINNLAITCIETHAGLLVLVIMMFVNMRRSFIRNSRKKDIPLNIVYIGIALMIISDCAWTVVSSIGSPEKTLAYIINIVYFLGSSAAGAYWFIFCTRNLETEFKENKSQRVLALIPYMVVSILYLLSPWYDLIFSIQNGEYVRGWLFFLDPLIKMGYVCFSSVLAVISGVRKKVGYLRRRDFSFVLFGVPVVVCGILQTVTGVDFNCIGVTFGLILIYVTGITNSDDENTDAMYSLAKSFEASYIVNMDTGKIRALHGDTMHDKAMPGMNSSDFESHFNRVLSEILLPQDKENTLMMFRMENVEKRFLTDSSFSFRYRVKGKSGNTEIHSASFIFAAGEEGKREFLLGISTLNSESLLYERNEGLSREIQKMDQINMGIIESVAKIVESRDKGSGEHIARVKKFTEILAREVMKEYPEFILDENKVTLISSASVLHDVGKIFIPDAVLLKPGRLNDDELRIMKTHSAKGCDALNMFPLGLDDAFLECALSICRWHHERYDGSGYPDGLKGEEIPIAAQIVSIADCFDALISDRPYKKAYSLEKAFDMVVGGECGCFSPKLIELMKKKDSELIEAARLYKSII